MSADAKPRKGPTATISATSGRAARWHSIFGDAPVPIMSPVETRVHIEGAGPMSCYLVDLSALSEAVLTSLIEDIAARSSEDPAVVRATLEQTMQFPVLADDITVLFDGRPFL